MSAVLNNECNLNGNVSVHALLSSAWHPFDEKRGLIKASAIVALMCVTLNPV